MVTGDQAPARSHGSVYRVVDMTLSAARSSASWRWETAARRHRVEALRLAERFARA
jgi:hypothetical protein